MSKVSMRTTNDYCPQTLFLYGTYKEDGTPDFGLFCWFSYCYFKEMGVMACIGGEKLTKERIHANKIFSANLVTEKLLPLADYFGNTDGHNPDKMKVQVAVDQGAVLNVPVLRDSPFTFELEVKQFVRLDDSEVMLCQVRNVLMDEMLARGDTSFEEKLRAIAPVRTTCATYFGWDGHTMGAWGEVMKRL